MADAPARPVFVLHEHRKPQPHYDLRLEEDGVLKSWAVPKGMPPDSRSDRLAVAVDDHDLEHATYTDADKDIADTGWWVLEDCIKRFPHGLATGDAGWTTAGEMRARWVIHVVGPNYRAGETDRSLLTSCYARALAVADVLGARSVAFPLVSAGIYGWPKSDAITAAVETLRSTSTWVAEARMVAFDTGTYDALVTAVSGG